MNCISFKIKEFDIWVFNLRNKEVKKNTGHALYKKN